MLSTIRSKFYCFYALIALFLVCIMTIVLQSNLKTISTNEILLEEFRYIQNYSRLIHLLQKERGLTANYFSNRTAENKVNLENARSNTDEQLGIFANTLDASGTTSRITQIRNQADQGKSVPSSTTKEYSLIIYRLIRALSSNSFIENFHHTPQYLIVENLISTREHLGKLRAYITTLLNNKSASEQDSPYIDSENSYYLAAKENLLSILNQEYPEITQDITRSNHIKSAENFIQIYSEIKVTNLSPNEWFRLSTQAMDYYLSIQNKLNSLIEEKLTQNIKSSKTTALAASTTTILAITLSFIFFVKYLNLFSSRISTLNIKMKSILSTNNYRIEIYDKNDDEISEISNSLNTLLKFTNSLIEEKDRLASRDKLTNLYNRHKFSELFALELERYKRHGTIFSLCIFDIDFFKKINDIYGHMIGDEVLVKLSSEISKNIRTNDVFARWGGEEFVLLLPSTTIQSALIFAEKIREIVEKISFTRNFNITISIGATEVTQADTQDSLIIRSDEALYESKKTGRNKVTSK